MWEVMGSQNLRDVINGRTEYICSPIIVLYSLLIYIFMRGDYCIERYRFDIFLYSIWSTNNRFNNMNFWLSSLSPPNIDYSANWERDTQTPVPYYWLNEQNVNVAIINRYFFPAINSNSSQFCISHLITLKLDKNNEWISKKRERTFPQWGGSYVHTVWLTSFKKFFSPLARNLPPWLCSHQLKKSLSFVFLLPPSLFVSSKHGGGEVVEKIG